MATIQSRGVTNVTEEENTPIEYEEIRGEPVTNVTPLPEPGNDIGDNSPSTLDSIIDIEAITETNGDNSPPPQRATAQMLGVNVSTVNRDVANATIDDITPIDIEVVASEDVANATPPPARMLGVSEKTIRNDTADNSALNEFTPIDIEVLTEAAADNSAPPPLPGWMKESGHSSHLSHFANSAAGNGEDAGGE